MVRRNLVNVVVFVSCRRVVLCCVVLCCVDVVLCSCVAVWLSVSLECALTPRVRACLLCFGLLWWSSVTVTIESAGL